MTTVGPVKAVYIRCGDTEPTLTETGISIPANERVFALGS
jgi:hypothetical protein